MSEIALKLIREAKEKRSTRLDLGNCGLTELPEELFECVWLEELIIENHRVKNTFYDVNYLLNPLAKEYKYDKTFENNIYFISTKISQLQNLKVLRIDGRTNNKWHLKDLSPLKDLINLQRLNVSNTNVRNAS